MFWMRNIIPLLFSNWELNVLIAYFLKETKAKRLTLNCIFLHNTWSKVEHFCIINRVFVQRQLWLRNGSFMEVSFATNYSYNGLHFKKYGVRKWRRNRLWTPRWSAELSLLVYAISTIILMPYWKWTICSSEDYNKIRYLYHVKKDLPTNQDL